MFFVDVRPAVGGQPTHRHWSPHWVGGQTLPVPICTWVGGWFCVSFLATPPPDQIGTALKPLTTGVFMHQVLWSRYVATTWPRLPHL